MSNSKFSVVVPTMWKYEPFINFLKDLVKFHMVDDIIIFNNDNTRTPNDPVLQHEKIRLIDHGTNIYVNPAWNQGVKLSKNKKICIANDDIIFDLKVFYEVDEYLTTEIGAIGISPGHAEHGQPPFVNGSIEIIEWTGQHTLGFGCLFFVHQDVWLDIPDSLKVYYGDNWLFDTNLWRGLKNYLITDLLHHTPYAQTTGGMINEFMEKETQQYHILLNNFKGNLYDKNPLELEYQTACNMASDINEHLPLLKEIADQCNHITEMGVCDGWSTRAFLNSNAVLRSYDINLNPTVQLLFNIAKERGKDAEYIQADVTQIEITETDLLFIDTWHAYPQLKKELELHSGKVRKYIMFHDTHSFGVTDEGGSGKTGLLPAIIEFIIANNNWKFKIHRTNNNGLTVIEKVS